jgi:hypothetical protein
MTTEPEQLEIRTNTRRTIVRMAVTYLPLAALTALGAVYSISHALRGSGGAWVPGFFITVFAIAFASEGLSAMRDLRAEPVIAAGPVRRTWSRGGLLWFFRSHYMHVNKDVYTVAPLTAASVHPGDTVEVEHWPHTKTVIRVRLLGHGSGDPAPDASPRR